MAEITLDRSGEAVTLPLLGEGGEQVLSIDAGKPHAGLSSKGQLDPRWGDHQSGQRIYTINARLEGPAAYEDALDLADLIKSHSGGDGIELSTALPEIDGPIEVAPAPTASALTLAYDPGRKDQVDVSLSLARVSSTQGSGDQPAETPRGVGNGPIELSLGSDAVELAEDVVVQREIGRPNSTLSESGSDFPIYIDKRKAASDTFDVSVVLPGESAQTLQDIAAERLGRGALELDFNGLFGMGAFDVVVDGSQAVRLLRQAGREGDLIVPNIDLRVVTA